jgi:hypothetical protein
MPRNLKPPFVAAGCALLLCLGCSQRAAPPIAGSAGATALPAASGGGGAALGDPAPFAGAASDPVLTSPSADPPKLPALDEDAGTDALGGHGGPKKVPPDPSIMFNWQETQPGPTNCQAGHFVGTFMCTFSPGQDAVTNTNTDAGANAAVLTGPVEFTLTKSQNGEFLEISNATINGYALALLNFNARLAGQLDCSTNKLAANAEDGAVGLGDAMILPILMFSGTLTGALDTTGDALMGDWSFLVTNQGDTLGVCTGPWTATRMP